MGNSPYSYMDPKLKGKTVVPTTTNGTKAINMAKDKSTGGGCAQQPRRHLQLAH